MNDLKHHERSMPMDDLLENKSSEWRIMGLNCDREADRLEADADDLDRGEIKMGGEKRREAGRLRAEAGRHQARADHAEAGALLVGRGEHMWGLRNSDLRSRAAAENRIVHDDADDVA